MPLTPLLPADSDPEASETLSMAVPGAGAHRHPRAA